MVILFQINNAGSKIWYKELESGILHLHRENDMPAVIYNDGQKEWFMNNRLIREEIPWDLIFLT